MQDINTANSIQFPSKAVVSAPGKRDLPQEIRPPVEDVALVGTKTNANVIGDIENPHNKNVNWIEFLSRAVVHDAGGRSISIETVPFLAMQSISRVESTTSQRGEKGS